MRRRYFEAPATGRGHTMAADELPACGAPGSKAMRRGTRRPRHMCGDCLAIEAGAATRESINRNRERARHQGILKFAQFNDDAETIAACQRWLADNPPIGVHA